MKVLIFLALGLSFLPQRTAGAGQALHKAIIEGNIAEVRSLLQKGADPNWQDESGFASLHEAVAFNRLDVARLLIDYGASVDTQDKQGWSPLWFAADRGYENLMSLLLSKGANANLQDGDGNTLLHRAVYYSKPKVARLLIAYGADVNATNPASSANPSGTPLYWAMSFGRHETRLEFVELLVRSGAAVNVRTKDGTTPLHGAAYNSADVVRFLLEKGGNPNVQDDNGQTPLHVIAAYPWSDGFERVRSALELIRHGANVNARDRKGWTPLHVAAYEGNPEVARTLLQNKADRSTKTINGDTALSLAASVVQSWRHSKSAATGGTFAPLQMGAKKETLSILQTYNSRPLLTNSQPFGAQEATRNARVQHNEKDGLDYVLIQPGTFEMGCSIDDVTCDADEHPRHKVSITKAFWIGQTEVTVGAYKRFAEFNARKLPPESRFQSKALNPGWRIDNLPIVNVWWEEAKAYCVWIGGWLPTEAQWEYAARGDSRQKSYGVLNDVAWFGDNSGVSLINSTAIEQRDPFKYLDRILQNGNAMKPVGRKRSNGFGLYDMLGNVSEWSADLYDERYYQRSRLQNPDGPFGSAFDGRPVVRGGSWYDTNPCPFGRRG